MNIRDKLKRLPPVKAKAAKSIPANSDKETDLGRFRKAIRGQAKKKTEVAFRSEPHRVEEAYDWSHAQGEFSIGSWRKLHKTKRALGLAKQRLVFLDTETTGLAGGVGTMAFMVGLGETHRKRFTLTQWYLSQHGQERAMLEQLKERLEGAFLLTFNGLRYDWPLLRNRFAMQRVPIPKLAGHLDLLPLCRSLLRRTLESFRLIHVERDFLRWFRKDDLPSSEVPEVFYSFLYQQDHAMMEPVLKHNAWDILSLSAVLAGLSEGLHVGPKEACPDLGIGFADWLARRGEHGTSARWLSALAGRVDSESPSVCEAACRLAAEHKRAGEHARAVDILLPHTQGGPMHIHRSSVHLALAKLYEHQLKAPEHAILHASLTVAAEGSELSERRQSRIRGRLA